MSRMLLLRGAIALLPITSVATAAPTPPNHKPPPPPRSMNYAARVYLPRIERPSTPVCAARFEYIGYSSRPYCPDPGEIRQLFIRGQVIPAGVGQPIGYAQLTSGLRAEYRLDATPDYVFASGYLYALDHGTKTVRRVIPVEVQR